MDDYTENVPNGGSQITLSAVQNGTTITIQYDTVPSTTVDAQMSYSISYLY